MKTKIAIGGTATLHLIAAKTSIEAGLPIAIVMAIPPPLPQSDTGVMMTLDAHPSSESLTMMLVYQLAQIDRRLPPPL